MRQVLSRTRSKRLLEFGTSRRAVRDTSPLIRRVRADTISTEMATWQSGARG